MLNLRGARVVLDEVSRLAPEGVGQSMQVVDAEVPFAPFDCAHVGTIQSGDVREVFL